jgi:hypothetical protein
VRQDVGSSSALSNNDDLFAVGVPKEEEDMEVDEEDEGREGRVDESMDEATAAMEAAGIAAEGDTTSATDGATEGSDSDSDTGRKEGDSEEKGKDVAPMNVDEEGAEQPPKTSVEEGTGSKTRYVSKYADCERGRTCCDEQRRLRKRTTNLVRTLSR